jgi:hypothetical protein
VAIKLERTESNHQTLEHEYNVYQKLQGGVGIPRTHWFGVDDGCNFMAIDRLGPSLHDLFAHCNSQFSVKTVTLLAVQLVSYFNFFK